MVFSKKLKAPTPIGALGPMGLKERVSCPRNGMQDPARVEDEIAWTGCPAATRLQG